MNPLIHEIERAFQKLQVCEILSKRPNLLPITHKFSSDEESELDVSETGKSIPDELAPWWRIIRTGKVASQPRKLNEVGGNGSSPEWLRIFCFSQLIQ